MPLTETDVPQPSISNLVAAAQSGAASVVDFEPAAEARPIWKTWGGAMAGLAAACFAFVAYFGTPSSVNDDSIARVISESAPTVAIAQSEESDYQTVFVLNPENTNDLLPGMRAVDDSFAWMTQLQFAPIERTEIRWLGNAASRTDRGAQSECPLDLAGRASSHDRLAVPALICRKLSAP